MNFMYLSFITCAVLSFLHQFSSPSCHVHPSPHLMACRQHSHHIRSQSAVFLLFARQRTLGFRSQLLLTRFILQSGDKWQWIESWPGKLSTSAPFFILSTLSHSLTWLTVIKPDLFCLTETWIKPTTTSAELQNCTPPASWNVYECIMNTIGRWLG